MQSPIFLTFNINFISLSTTFLNFQRSTKTLFQDSLLSYIIVVSTACNCNKYKYLYESNACSFWKTSSVITSTPNLIKIGLISQKLDGVYTYITVLWTYPNSFVKIAKKAKTETLHVIQTHPKLWQLIDLKWHAEKWNIHGIRTYMGQCSSPLRCLEQIDVIQCMSTGRLSLPSKF